MKFDWKLPESVLPRNNDFRILIEWILDEPSTYMQVKNSFIMSSDAIVYSDSIELYDKYVGQITSTDSILYMLKNGCDTLLAKISERGQIDLATDYFNKTTLHRCCDRGDLEKIVSLHKYGANVEAVDKYGATALMHAARNGHTDTVQCLVEHGANVEAVDKDDKTALIHVAFRGHTDTVKYLVEHGANVEAVDEHGQTALIHAASNGRTDTVKYLDEHNSKPNE